MIFLTVGTQFSFNRLVEAVDKVVEGGKVAEEVYAQIGVSSYKPHNFEYVESLDKEIFDDYIRKASSVISHAGMGTIVMALDNSKPLLVMPRLKEYGEVVNDHQVAVARKFEQLGHILVAYREDQLAKKIEKLKSFIPRPRKNQVKAVSDKIAEFLDQVSYLKK